MMLLLMLMVLFSGFQWLLNTISSEFGKISARVEHDVAIQVFTIEKLTLLLYQLEKTLISMNSC